jgi:glutamyl-tRNA synthetase
VFDYKKLDWFNGQYIRKKTDGELRRLLLPYLEKDGVVSSPPTAGEERILDGMIPLVKERLKVLSEVSELSRFLFQDVEVESPESLIPKKGTLEDARTALECARELLSGFAGRSDEENEELFRNKAEETGMKLGALLMPLRVAITGSSVSPPLFGAIRLLGEETAVERVERALEIVQQGREM